MDRVDRIGKPAMLVLLAAALAGCYEVGSSSSDAGAPDADSDTDIDTDLVMLSSGFEDALGSCAGCGDVFIYCHGLYDVEQVELVFWTEGLALEMYEGGYDYYHQALAFPDADATIEIRLGLDMAADECTDEGTGDGVVWRTYTPTAGEGDIGIVRTSGTWTEWDLPASATLELIDVVFAPIDGEPGDPVTLPYLLVEDISVGWFPG